MTPAELAALYRMHPAQCIKLAQSFDEASAKMSLLHMAQAWIRLAEQSEKNGETALVCESLVTPPRSPEQT
jgi:hypothetical protein